jgi:hypothetical protein
MTNGRLFLRKLRSCARPCCCTQAAREPPLQTETCKSKTSSPKGSQPTALRLERPRPLDCAIREILHHVDTQLAGCQKSASLPMERRHDDRRRDCAPENNEMPPDENQQASQPTEIRLARGSNLHRCDCHHSIRPSYPGMACSDLDWIIIDMDHGSIDIGTTGAMIAATTGTQLVPFVSIASAWQAKLPLDIGALGSTFRAARFPAVQTDPAQSAGTCSGRLSGIRCHSTRLQMQTHAVGKSQNGERRRRSSSRRTGTRDWAIHISGPAGDSGSLPQ